MRQRDVVWGAFLAIALTGVLRGEETKSLSIAASAPETTASTASISVGAPVFDLAVSANGEYVAFGGQGGLLGVVDAQNRVLWKTNVYDKDAHVTSVGFV